MAGRGPSPAPTAIKLIKGVQPKRINKREAKMPPEIPEAPAHLDEVGRVEWARVATLLCVAGLLVKVDRGGLAAYCQLWSRWVAVEETIKAQGMIIQGKKFPILHPFVRYADGIIAQLRPILAEFGMTPASRSRIKADVPPPLSAIEAFARKHG